MDAGRQGGRMDSDPRYYWRRACEEMAAALRAVTPAARARHEQLLRMFMDRLKEINAPCPFTDSELTQSLGAGGGWGADPQTFSLESQPERAEHV